MNFIDQNYLDRAALPSNLPACTRFLELVKRGCSDTTEWGGDCDSFQRKGYAESLQFEILKSVIGRCGGLLACGVGVDVGASQGSRVGQIRLPPMSGFGRHEMPELHEAYKVLRSIGRGGDLPGDSLMAAALLLAAAAELERALECPAGFAKLLQQ